MSSAALQEVHVVLNGLRDPAIVRLVQRIVENTHLDLGNRIARNTPRAGSFRLNASTWIFLCTHIGNRSLLLIGIDQRSISIRIQRKKGDFRLERIVLTKSPNLIVECIAPAPSILQQSATCDVNTQRPHSPTVYLLLRELGPIICVGPRLLRITAKGIFAQREHINEPDGRQHLSKSPIA